MTAIIHLFSTKEKTVALDPLRSKICSLFLKIEFSSKSGYCRFIFQRTIISNFRADNLEKKKIWIDYFRARSNNVQLCELRRRREKNGGTYRRLITKDASLQIIITSALYAAQALHIQRIKRQLDGWTWKIKICDHRHHPPITTNFSWSLFLMYIFFKKTNGWVILCRSLCDRRRFLFINILFHHHLP